MTELIAYQAERSSLKAQTINTQVMNFGQECSWCRTDWSAEPENPKASIDTRFDTRFLPGWGGPQ